MTVPASLHRPRHCRRALPVLAAGTLLVLGVTAAIWSRDTSSAGMPRPAATGLQSVGLRDPAVVSEADRRCLAEAVYFEARNEPRVGRLAVAHVVLNRAASTRFAGSLCGVVRQGEDRGRGRCQFSFRCDGHAEVPQEAEAWADARAVADEALRGNGADPTRGALYYHATYVQPDWAPKLKRTTTIGKHIYYTR